ncbi:unnamed protein product [Meganyctiphanes norvegica]|uniref:Uncharacterized protein n=1 Tax=Meganyctiphanes norvegica TaxID=48144 RepID=A0AAV2PTG1_MEGNR
MGVEALRKLSKADTGLLGSDDAAAVEDDVFSTSVFSLFEEGNFNVAVTVTSASLVSVFAGSAVIVKLVTILLFSSLFLSVQSVELAAVVVILDGVMSKLCLLEEVLETTELLEDGAEVKIGIGVNGRETGFGLSSSVVWKSRFIIFLSLC